MTDTKRLETAIQESGYKLTYIAERMGLSLYGLSKKIKNETEFKASEIDQLCSILQIKTLTEKERIFFANKVE